MTTTPTTLTARETLAFELAAALDYAHNNEHGDITHAELALTELIDEYSEDAVLDYIYNYHLELDAADDWADQLRDDYIGEITARDYAEQLVDEGVFGEVAEGPLAYYIDYDAIARDLLMGDVWESDNGHLFRNS